MNNGEVKVFALTSSIELADEICSILKIPRGRCSVKHFADGEILVEPEETVRGRNVFLVQSTCAPTSATLMEVLIALDALKRASAKEVTVVIPYFGYARQDRKARARQPITARLVADLLEVAGADRIITIDLHAQQIQGFFKIPMDELTAVSMMGQYFRAKNIEGDIVVVSPDHGGATRARKLSDTIPESTVALIDKRRTKPNVAESVNIIGDVNNKTAIIIDDMIDTGGSLMGAIDLLFKHGARAVYAACTHAVLSHPAVERINNSRLEELVITNTIELTEDRKSQKIKQLSVGNMLAKTIEAVKNNYPVSDIYNLFND